MDQALFAEILREHQPQFHPVVSFRPDRDRLFAVDLTKANMEITASLLNDTAAFSAYIREKLAAAGALYGIGGYGEHRTIYQASPVFDAPERGEEPRRLHLGTDIWGKPGTAVTAPLDGIVHSFAFNNRFGDYGGTIILSHRLGTVSFFTLYGHLSLNSLKNMHEGYHVEKGEVFAEFGIPSENGQWPPHLHFQLIQDMGSWTGDYPGVCKYAEKDKWMANSPDPDLILQLNRYIR